MSFEPTTMKTFLNLPSRRALALLGALLLALVFPVAGHAEPADPGDEDVPSFQLFGYLSQAYAISDGNQFLGITKDGTADYRTLAVQARFKTDNDRELVVQVSHERLGNSPLQQFKQDLMLDWAFFRTPLGESTSLAVGRVPVPIGIYNEIQDVGSLLPFYRPPVLFYSEVAFGTETVDGVRVSHDFAEGSPWSLQASAYFGDVPDFPEVRGPQLATAKVKRAVGAQLWLSTPVAGLRFGLGGQHLPIKGDIISAGGGDANFNSWLLSMEASHHAFELRGEYRHTDFGAISADTYYLQPGVRLGSRFALHAQVTGITAQTPVGRHQYDSDRVLGVTYHLAAQQVLKLEVHRDKGYGTEVPIRFLGRDRPTVTKYAIFSLSTSF